MVVVVLVLSEQQVAEACENDQGKNKSQNAHIARKDAANLIYAQ